MTWPACSPEPSAIAPVSAGLQVRTTADGSFSLFSPRFGEGFHRASGALAEARQTFVGPAALERFVPGHCVVVVEVCVGTGSNTAALVEAAVQRGLQLQWYGLELEAAPLQLALASAGFCRQWRPQALAPLQQLAERGRWDTPFGSGQMLWGDARTHLPDLVNNLAARVDLVLMDAFSPRHCPELWTQEFLAGLARLLLPTGRLLTYCSAAAVRASLRRADLALAAITSTEQRWSGGTAASPQPLPVGAPGAAEFDSWIRPLTPMELEHLQTNAAVPYRDPTGRATAAEILQARSAHQRDPAHSAGLETTSAWRRRWGVDRSPTGVPVTGPI